MAAFDALDVQQLELLRGPQGTLFGKNTTAGVLNITTKKPTFTQRAQRRAVRRPASATHRASQLSGAVLRHAGGRLSVYKTHDDGYITNLYNGDKVQGGDREGVRAQLLYEPNATSACA
jgi:iron complex outermembrane receptor protein